MAAASIAKRRVLLWAVLAGVAYLSAAFLLASSGSGQSTFKTTSRDENDIVKRSLQESSQKKKEEEEEEGGLTAHGKHRQAKMDSYLSLREQQCDGGKQWQSIDMARNGMFNTYLFGDRFVKPESGYPDEERYVGMTSCSMEEEGGETGWQVYRLGPFVGVGGSDWHQVWVHPLPPPEKAKFITGKMAAPVDEHGTILGHPPLYSHHTHVDFSGVNHILETHGDTTCSEEGGGLSCYLHSYPEGYGLPFNATDNHDFLSLNFMLDDLREYPAPPMVFYQEIALKWSSRESVKPISIATLHMLPGGTHPFSTTLVTERPNVIWSTAKWLSDGRVLISEEDQLPWFHSHRKFCHSVWVFAASPEELGLTQDLLQPVDDNESVQPTESYDLVWTPDSEDATQALMDRIRKSAAGMDALRCWSTDSEQEKMLEYVNGTDSSALYPESWHQNWKESWYDRAGEVHCDPWSFKKGDSYTVVTLNGVDDRISADDLSIMTQHGAFFAAFESTGPELGPTMEVYGPYSNDLLYRVALPSSWMPPGTFDGNPSESQLAEDQSQSTQVLNYLVNELGMPDVSLKQSHLDSNFDFYKKKKHDYYTAADEAIVA
jgi:hypothetical protein